MGRRDNRERREGLLRWAKSARDAGEITKKDHRRIKRACRWQPDRVDEELDDVIEEAAEDDRFASLQAPGAGATEMDWEAFFKGLAEFAKEILPVIMTICPA